ncbi:hypothetical protein FACS189447_04100 [Spirochaetia bacterium]|nr:hypothetical protein FACS189447_04100 [Spirochaetia bacterium]
MSLFCLLWMPLFYLFWHTVAKENASSGGVWALLLGSIVALIQFFLGNLVKVGGFGLSLWVSACIDIIALPAVLPLLVYLALVLTRALSGTIDFARFALLWLVPWAAIRAVSWSAGNDPTLLILAPLLWTAIAVGVPFFINLLLAFFRWYVIIPCGLGILILPFTAATSWWAFSSQMFSYGMIFLFISFIPLIISMILSFADLRR